MTTNQISQIIWQIIGHALIAKMTLIYQLAMLKTTTLFQMDLSVVTSNFWNVIIGDSVNYCVPYPFENSFEIIKNKRLTAFTNGLSLDYFCLNQPIK